MRRSQARHDALARADDRTSGRWIADAVQMAVLCAALFASVVCRAGDESAASREEQLRAGYLLNFVKFVDWPSGMNAERWTLCFVGGEGIRSAISAAPQQINAHPIVTRVLTRGEPVAGCQLLYVESGAPFAAERLSKAALPAVLTVSDAHDFVRNGGVVELFAEGNRLRFNINLDNARAAGLRISSSLLQLASHIEESGK